MSHDATRWAWQQQTGSSSRKAVLVSMADRAGEDHTCYPSLKRLELDTELNRKTLVKVIGELEELGFIRWTGARRGNGVKVYQLVGVNGREEIAVTSTKNGTSTNFSRTSTKNGTATSTKNGTENRHMNRLEPSDIYHDNAHENFQSQSDDQTIESDSLPPAKSSRQSKASKTPPQGFAPTDVQLKRGSAHGIDVQHEFSQFLAWASANGRAYQDWTSGFSYWLGNAISRKPKPRPINTNHSQGQYNHATRQPNHQPKPNSNEEYAIIRAQRRADLQRMGYDI